MTIDGDGVQIRLGTGDDVVLLAKIESAGDAMFAEAGHPEFVGGASVSIGEATDAIEHGWLIVAELSGADVVGFALLGRLGLEMQLHQLSVHPSVGRQGIGTRLLRHVIEVVSEAKETTLVLNTQADVAWNMPWYERFGFQVVPEAQWTTPMRETTKIQQRQGLKWATRVHMRLIL